MQGRARLFQAIFRPSLSGSAATGDPAPATIVLPIAVAGMERRRGPPRTGCAFLAE
jgi:hypothetical protein